MSQTLRAERHGGILCKGVQLKKVQIDSAENEAFAAEENDFYVIPAFGARDTVDGVQNFDFYFQASHLLI